MIDTGSDRAWWQARHIMPADLAPAGNAFTMVRWLLAAAVMVSHAWDLTQLSTGLDPSVALLSFPVSRLAVLLFFTLSGFLVVGSLFRRGVGAFLAARALRLLPGLWAMLLLVPPLFWWAFGTIPLGDFLAASETQRFVWRNGLLLGQAYQLPGMFELHSFARVVNGSLWTIPKEVHCYVALALLALAGLTRSPRRLALLIVAAMALHLALLATGLAFHDGARRLAFSFALGVLGWLWRDRLPLSLPLAAALVAAALAWPATNALKIALVQVAFGYLMFNIAFGLPPRWKAASARLPDYSYGIYIYGFPMQQAAIALGATTPLADLGLALLLTLPAAALSWHFVERPALRLMRGKSLPAPAVSRR